MSYNNNRAGFDTLRSLAFGSISGTYAALGTAVSLPITAFTIKNATNGDIIISFDSSNANGNLFLPANSYGAWDVKTNAPRTSDYLLPAGTQFYVKELTAPTSGSVYLEIMVANIGA